MRAVTVVPRRPGSLRLDDVPRPDPSPSQLLVRTLFVGICGTDRELIDGHFGEAPQGQSRLVLGHESLGRVVEAPAGSGYAPGELVVGIVRHPDPLPCASCAAGEWDMCENGRYTEHGIKQRHGFAAEQFAIDAGMAVKVDAALGAAGVLLEPASVLAKAWEHIERIGRRARWTPRTVLVTGAGPVGLMAAMMGVQRGLQVDVQDRNEDGPKPQRVRELGAGYFSAARGNDYDIAIECTGAPEVIGRVLQAGKPNAIVCLAGLSSAPNEATLEAARFNQSLVLRNQVVFGTVNANRRHYQAAAQALARADRGWLERLLTRKVPLQEWPEAYEKAPGDVKTVLCFED